MTYEKCSICSYYTNLEYFHDLWSLSQIGDVHDGVEGPGQTSVPQILHTETMMRDEGNT